MEGGIRLTYATLGAFIKYPKESLPKKPTNQIEDKKYGIFQSDVPFFKEVAQELGLISTGINGNVLIKGILWPIWLKLLMIFVTPLSTLKME